MEYDNKTKPPLAKAGGGLVTIRVYERTIAAVIM